MKTRLTPVMLALLALAAIAPAQDPPKTSPFTASIALDERLRSTPIVAARLRTFTDVFDRKGLDLDLQGLTVIGTELRVGTALTYTLRKTIPFSREFRPRVDLTAGPWVNYGLGSGKLSGGIYLGLGWHL